MNEYIVSFFDTFLYTIKTARVRANSKLEAGLIFLDNQEAWVVEGEAREDFEHLMTLVWNCDCVMEINKDVPLYE